MEILSFCFFSVRELTSAPLHSKQEASYQTVIVTNGVRFSILFHKRASTWPTVAGEVGDAGVLMKRITPQIGRGKLAPTDTQLGEVHCIVKGMVRGNSEGLDIIFTEMTPYNQIEEDAKSAYKDSKSCQCWTTKTECTDIHEN